MFMIQTCCPTHMFVIQKEPCFEFSGPWINASLITGQQLDSGRQDLLDQWTRVDIAWHESFVHLSYPVDMDVTGANKPFRLAVWSHVFLPGLHLHPRCHATDVTFQQLYPIRSMWLVYLATLPIQFQAKYVGKYTCSMDPMVKNCM